MAYLIVRNVDASHPDPHLDAKQYKRGYVTSVRAEAPQAEVSFGQKVLRLPEWVIVHCPDMSYEEADSFCSIEPGDRKTNPVLRPRAFQINPLSLPPNQKFVEMTHVELTGNKILLEPLIDTKIIGDVGNIIG